MTILVFSDLHGLTYNFTDVLDRQKGKADWVFFLGDGLNALSAVQPMYRRDFQFLSVSGNCDAFYLDPDKPDPTDFKDLCGFRFMLTHGHEYYVKQSTGALIEIAKKRGADVLLYGHTHVPENRYIPADGENDKPLYVMNPGSISKPEDGHPTYGVIDIVKGQISLNIADV